MSDDAEEDKDIALALSGGGSRAIAFHLGCLRALNDRGLLKRVKTVSSVSGGSVIAATYCLDGDVSPGAAGGCGTSCRMTFQRYCHARYHLSFSADDKNWL